MFGDYRLRDVLSVSVGGFGLEFLRSGNVVRYRGPGGGKSVVCGCDSPVVSVRPAPPVGKYLSFIVMDLVDEVVVPAGASVSLWAVLPVGVVVEVDGFVVDRFNLSRVKRCLYEGFVGSRLITGCVRVSPVFSRPSGDVVGGINFVVKNSTGLPVVVRRVPVFVAGVPVFYTSGSAYYPWYKVVVGESYASVMTNYTSPVENVRSAGAVRVHSFEARVEVRKGGGVVVL